MKFLPPFEGQREQDDRNSFTCVSSEALDMIGVTKDGVPRRSKRLKAKTSKVFYICRWNYMRSQRSSQREGRIAGVQ